MGKFWLRLASVAGVVVTCCAPARSATPQEVAGHYADMAEAMYGDALASAAVLQASIDGLIASPSAATLGAARAGWIAARPWYQQTEGYRFGNPVVDDWEGRVNAWPLDEGLIDYVDGGRYGATSDENPLYAANVIANPSIRIGNDILDMREISPAAIRALHAAGGSEANVATGYHAIEFLLWGQDLNGAGPGAGNRPYTDYEAANCTGGNCARRAAYLKAAAALLVADLEEMAGHWKAGGQARRDIESKDAAAAMSAILTGLGSLSYGELAGQRLKLGLILHDPEEEHDCFSDNTHNSHYHDQAGMLAIYSGTLARRDGTTLDGPGLQDYAAIHAPDEAKALDRLMADTLARLAAIKDKADSGAMAYDQMISKGNTEGNGLVQAAIDGLVAQTRGIEALVGALNISVSVEGSDSLDNPAAVTEGDD